MRWVLANPARFLHERAELERLAAEGWLSCNWRVDVANSVLQVDLDMTIHGRVYAGILIYPDVFPNSPPYIRPRDGLERRSAHQYGAGGPLCLEWRADNWRPEITGADMVRSAYGLLSTEGHPETPAAVPSAHRVTMGQDARGSASRVVATADLVSAMEEMPSDTPCKLSVVAIGHTGGVNVRFVSQLSAGDWTRPMIDLPRGLSEYYPLFNWPETGWAFKSAAFETCTRPTTFDGLLALLSSAGLDAAGLLETCRSNPIATTLVVLLANSAASAQFLTIDSGEPRTLRHPKVFGMSRQASRLAPEAARLAGVRVGIVGLGSVGSKIAKSLGRSGFRKFVLVDDDILGAENVVRHELDWAAVGVHKVDGLSEALRLIAPGLEVSVHAHRVAGQESSVSAAAVLREIAQCDLIIDASANAEVFLQLAGVAKASHTPLVWAEVFATGYGGLVARARPDMDPNPLAVRDALYAHLETLPVAPFKQARGYDDDPAEDAQVAYDCDVGLIAAATTRLAVDTALKRSPSEFPHAVYLIGMRKEWIFEEPFDVRPVAVEGPGWESEIAATDPETVGIAIEAILTLINTADNADDRPAA